MFPASTFKTDVELPPCHLPLEVDSRPAIERLGDRLHHQESRFEIPKANLEPSSYRAVVEIHHLAPSGSLAIAVVPYPNALYDRVSQVQ